MNYIVSEVQTDEVCGCCGQGLVKKVLKIRTFNGVLTPSHYKNCNYCDSDYSDGETHTLNLYIIKCLMIMR